MIVPDKINLAHLPTPLEKLKYRSKNFLIKRDDYTGLDFSGNKIRKLEYLLYRAKKRRAEIIFTCGTRSNSVPNFASRGDSLIAFMSNSPCSVCQALARHVGGIGTENQL